MRFHEFAPQPAKPVLKISQQKALGNKPATPWPANTPPTATSPEPIKVSPNKWKNEWLQKYLAAQIAKNAQTVKPTSDDLAVAFWRYGQAQSEADRDYEQTSKQRSSSSDVLGNFSMRNGSEPI